MFYYECFAGPETAGLHSKKKTVRAQEQDRPDVKQRRIEWWQKIPFIDPERLVFLDESGVKTDLSRLYGWALSKERCYGTVPQGHWCTSTIVSAIRKGQVTASMVLDGPMDTESFVAYVEQVLVPTLKEDDVVVLDNLAPHKDPRVKTAIESVNAHVWYLPPYSPDYNPIEMMWSKIKNFLRKVAARTIDLLFDAVGQALETITANDIIGWFKACGYIHD